ncbi:hypothetical protein D3C73_711700 [compost metagenome]
MVSNHPADFGNTLSDFLPDGRNSGVFRRFALNVYSQCIVLYSNADDRILKMTVYNPFNIVQADFFPVLQFPAYPFDNRRKALLLYTPCLHRPKVSYNVIGNKTDSRQHLADA